MARKQSPAQLARVAVPDALGSSVPARAELLALAQVSPAEQALLTRLVINKLNSALSADKVQRLVVNAGLHQSDVREFVDQDHAMQLRAAAELVELLGLKPSRSAGPTSAGPVQIAITFVDRPDKMVKAKVIQGVIQHPSQ